MKKVKSKDLPKETQEDRDIILNTTLDEIIQESNDYRQGFTAKWLQIEQQINLIPPDWWEKKEEWKTKIYIPASNKISESAHDQLMELLFGSRRFYTIVGIDNDQDKIKAKRLSNVLDVFFEMGKFHLHNDFVMREAINIGTSILKFLPDAKNGFNFSWRSIKNCYLDPNAVVDFDNSNYWVDEYNENISDIMANKDYSDKAKDELLLYISGLSENGKTDKLISIPNTEGNANLKVSAKYTKVDIQEFWGYFPVKQEVDIDNQEAPYYKNEWRSIIRAKEHVILRNVTNTVELIPAVKCRVKRRLYHIYGNGFILNITGLQDLSNSLVNLGFDSAKLKAFGIIKKDDTGVADASTIVLEPGAVWEMMPGKMDAVEVDYLGEDRMSDIVRDLSYIDQLIQDSSISRTLQGVDFIKKKDETLGQTEIKLAGSEKGVLKIGRQITEDYIIPTLSKMFKVMVHKSHIKMYQKLVDKILGFNELPNPANDALLAASIKDKINYKPLMPLKESKLDLEELGEMNIDFRALGIVNFEQKNKVPQQMREVLLMASQDPEIAMIIQKDEVLKRWFQSGEISDWEDLLSSEDSLGGVQNILQQIIGQQGGQSQQGGGGNPPSISPSPSPIRMPQNIKPGGVT